MCHLRLEIDRATWLVGERTVAATCLDFLVRLITSTVDIGHQTNFPPFNSVRRSGRMHREFIQKELARRVGNRSHMRKDEGAFDARKQRRACTGTCHSCWRYSRSIL